MTEESHESQSSNNLKIRMEEQLAKTNLHALKHKDLLNDPKVRAFVIPENPTADLLVSFFAEGAKLRADLQWAGSMMKAGLSAEIIMRTWDLKDEASRQSKESKSQGK